MTRARRRAQPNLVAHHQEGEISGTCRLLLGGGPVVSVHDVIVAVDHEGVPAPEVDKTLPPVRHIVGDKPARRGNRG